MRGRLERRTVLALAVLWPVLWPVLWLAPATAWAHNSLVSSSPPGGTAVDQAPAEVRLEYDDPVSQRFGTVVVTGPDGGQWQDGDLQVSGTVATQPLRPLGPAGTYEVAWRVVSADGHPVSGTFDFELTTAGPGGSDPTASPSPTSPTTTSPATTPDAAAASDSGDDTRWPLVVGVVTVAVLALVVLLVLTAFRRRENPGA